MVSPARIAPVCRTRRPGRGSLPTARPAYAHLRDVPRRDHGDGGRGGTGPTLDERSGRPLRAQPGDPIRLYADTNSASALSKHERGSAHVRARHGVDLREDLYRNGDSRPSAVWAAT